MNGTILITGATGNVGSQVLIRLPADADIRAGLVTPNSPDRPLARDVTRVEFDFARPETFRPALEGVEKLFLLRPPTLADVNRYFVPVIQAAEAEGVRHVVFLSLLGAENNRIVPHAKIEKLLTASPLQWTFLRAGFFMQNLNTTHRAEIRDRDEIFIPAGNGTTSFTDVRDIAAAAAIALTEPCHENKAYPITGAQALTYTQVADMLTEELGRKIRYANPSLARFALRQLIKGSTLSYAVITTAIYATARYGKAGGMTDDFKRLTGRDPISIRQYIADYRASWLK